MHTPLSICVVLDTEQLETSDTIFRSDKWVVKFFKYTGVDYEADMQNFYSCKWVDAWEKMANLFEDSWEENSPNGRPLHPEWWKPMRQVWHMY